MLLRVPVLTRGIRLGEVENVILDAEEPRILGLEVHCGDGARRFLPFATARRAEHRIGPDGALVIPLSAQR
jgi:sporulation protein YlmC with PRC-barrel domain